MEVLRKGWDDCIGANAMLEGKILGLERYLTNLDRTNRRLQHKIDTAPDPYDERDSLRIATLEARAVRMEELKAKDKVIAEKNALLKEKEELTDTLDAALISKNRIIEQLHRQLHRNYYNLVHLGSRCYHDRDLAERLQLG